MVSAYSPIATPATINAVIPTPLLFFLSTINYSETLPKFLLLLAERQTYDKQLVMLKSTLDL